MIKLPNSYSLEIEEHILARFRGCRQNSFNPFESGGILMGRKKGKLFIVDFASTPGTGDLRSSCRFIRNKKRAQRIINRELLNSGNRRIYIGEWHTHNEENPSPSALDINEWHLTFTGSKLNANFILCIIVGSRDEIFNIHLSIQTSNGNIEVLKN